MDEKQRAFEPLVAYLERLPAIRLPAGRKSISCCHLPDGTWSVSFSLDTKHPLAWRHVQELGYVLNGVSLTEHLPTVFKPISPPPYLNGGEEFLSWTIESTHPELRFTPGQCAKWLEGRLPRPVEDLCQWALDEEA